MTISNIFSAIPDDLPAEISETLLGRDAIRIERIVSQGQASPEDFWYDQNENEWVLLLAGRAGLAFDDEDRIRELSPGDFILIPANRKHRVAFTDAAEPTIWLAIFFR